MASYSRIQLTGQGSLDSTPYLNYYLAQKEQAAASRKSIENQLIKESTDYLSKMDVANVDGQDLPGVMKAYDNVKNAYTSYASAFAGDDANVKSKAYEQLTAAKAQLVNLLGVAKQLKNARGEFSKAIVDARNGKGNFDPADASQSYELVNKPADQWLANAGKIEIPRVADITPTTSDKVFKDQRDYIGRVTRDKEFVTQDPLQETGEKDAVGNKLYIRTTRLSDAGLNRVDQMSLATYNAHPWVFNKMFDMYNNPNNIHTSEWEQMDKAADLFKQRYNRVPENGKDLAIAAGLLQVSSEGKLGIISTTKAPAVGEELKKKRLTTEGLRQESLRIGIQKKKEAGEITTDWASAVNSQLDKGQTDTLADGSEVKYIGFNTINPTVRDRILKDVRANSDKNAGITAFDLRIQRNPYNQNIEVVKSPESSNPNTIAPISYSPENLNDLMASPKSKGKALKAVTTTAPSKTSETYIIGNKEYTIDQIKALDPRYTDDVIKSAVKSGKIKIK